MRSLSSANLSTRQPARVLGLTSAAIGLALPATAWSPPQTQVTGASLAVETPLGGVKEIAIGRLSGRYEADLLQLTSAGQLRLAYQPARFNSLIDVAQAVSSFAVRTDPAQAEDLVVAIQPTGLLRVHYTLAAGASSNLVSAAWTNVTDLTFQPSGILLGLDPQDRVLRRRLADMSADLPSIQISSGDLQVESMDWNQDSISDYVIRSASSIRVISGAAGNPVLFSDAAAGADDRIAVARGSQQSPADVLCRTRYFPGTGTFLQCLNGADQNDPWFQIGSFLSTALGTGDVDGFVGLGTPDGMSDLLFVDSNSGLIGIMQRNTPIGNAAGFLMFMELNSINSEDIYLLTSPEDIYPLALTTGDLDLDGDLDVGFFGESETPTAWLGWQLDNRIQRKTFIPASIDVQMTDPQENQQRLSVTTSGGGPIGATHLQAIVLAHTDGSNQFLSPIPVTQSNGQNSIFLPFSSGTPGITSGTLFLDNPNPFAVWNVIYRCVELDASGNVKKAWPSMTFLVEKDANGPQAHLFNEAIQASLEQSLPPIYLGVAGHSGQTQSAGGRPGDPPPILP